MPDTPHIHQALLEVMREVATVAKDLTVSGYGGGYKAVSHDAVVANIRPALLKHGITVTYSVTDFTEQQYTVQGKNGERTEYRATVTLSATFTAVADGSSVVVTCVGTGVDSGDKASGKAISYAKKYSLLTNLMLITGEDTDMHASEEGLRSETQLERAKRNQEQAESDAHMDRLKAMGRQFSEMAGREIATQLWNCRGKRCLNMSNKDAAEAYGAVIATYEHAQKSLGQSELDALMVAYCNEYQEQGNRYDLFKRLIDDIPRRAAEVIASESSEEEPQW